MKHPHENKNNFLLKSKFHYTIFSKVVVHWSYDLTMVLIIKVFSEMRLGHPSVIFISKLHKNSTCLLGIVQYLWYLFLYRIEYMFLNLFLQFSLSFLLLKSVFYFHSNSWGFPIQQKFISRSSRRISRGILVELWPLKEISKF
jgi:hypothetical protein